MPQAAERYRGMEQPMRIDITVKGTPKAQPRPRAFARKMGNGQVVARVYDDASAEGWKSRIAFFAREHTPAVPMEGPIRLDIDFFFPRPKYLTRKKDPDGPMRHTSKPDRDNLDKAVLDCLKTLGFFRDDSQVCEGFIRKFYVSKSGTPGARIAMETLTNQTDSVERDVPAPLFEMAST